MGAAAQLLKPAKEDAIRVVSLVRVSSEQQAGESRAGLARQKEMVRRTIAQHSLVCIEDYELHTSGTLMAGNPVVKAILARILAGEIQGIVVADLDRLFRPDKFSSYNILAVFQEMGASIFSSDIVYNLDSKDGRLFSSIRSAISGYELSLMQERQQGAKEQKRKRGQHPNSEITLPLGVGYSRKDETFHYTEKIGLVKELFRLFDEEGVHNYSELGRRVGLGGAGVRVVLRNPIYLGWRLLDKRRGAKRTSRSGVVYREKVARPESEVIRVKVLDGIVSQECFDRVQAEMARLKFNFLENHRSNDAVNINTGIAFCGHCFEPMMALSGKGLNKGGIGYYKCKANHYQHKAQMGGCAQPHLRADEFDAATVALTTNLLRSPAYLAKILEENEAKTKETVVPFPTTSFARNPDEEFKRRDARLLAAYEEGVITVDELRAKRTALRKEKEAMDKLTVPKPPPAKSEFLQRARLLVRAALRFPSITDKLQQKKVVHGLLSEILVKDKAIVGFRLRNALLDTDGDSHDTQNATVFLPTPLPVGKPPEHLPAGQKRCVRCGEVKSRGLFYKQLNQCAPCRKELERVRHERRQARRKEAKGSPPS